MSIYPLLYGLESEHLPVTAILLDPELTHLCSHCGRRLHGRAWQRDDGSGLLYCGPCTEDLFC